MADPNSTPAQSNATPKSQAPSPASQFNSSQRKKKKSGSKYYKPIVHKATSTQANRTIILAVGAGVGIVLIARVSGTPGTQQLNNPGSLIKVALGTGGTIIILMVVAEVAPDLAIAMAWLIFIGALFTYGVPFGQALIKGTLRPGLPNSTLKGGANITPDNPKGKSAPPNNAPFDQPYNPFNPFQGGGIIS